jgi:hypothetical protein
MRPLCPLPGTDVLLDRTDDAEGAPTSERVGAMADLTGTDHGA